MINCNDAHADPGADLDNRLNVFFSDEDENLRKLARWAEENLSIEARQKEAQKASTLAQFAGRLDSLMKSMRFHAERFFPLSPIFF